MPIHVKICGIKTEAALAAAVDGGARWVGFVFHPASPRAVTPDRAAELGRNLPPQIGRCGLFVDKDAHTVCRAAEHGRIDVIQLHGNEDPEFAHAVGKRTGLRVMKAMTVAAVGDLDRAALWSGAVDMLLFDAKPPNRAGALPGGNGVPFDWRLLHGFAAPMPWMLSGGLDAANLAEAVAVSGAERVDVSSGVESAPGIKDPAMIKAFLAAARRLEPPRSS